MRSRQTHSNQCDRDSEPSRDSLTQTTTSAIATLKLTAHRDQCDRATHRRKIDRTLMKTVLNRPKIDDKSILGRFGRPRPLRGGVRTRSGQVLEAQTPPQGRSWDAPSEPRAAKSHPKACPSCPKTLQDPLNEPYGRLCCTERSRTRLRIDFSLVLSCRAKSPMCLAYQFLQCFVAFARS